MRENRNFRVAQDVLSERLRANVCAVKESTEKRESRWVRSFVGRPCVEGERTNRKADELRLDEIGECNPLNEIVSILSK